MGEVVDIRDPRALVSGLRIKGESSKGQAWELSDGSYIIKDQQDKKWRIKNDDGKATEHKEHFVKALQLAVIKSKSHLASTGSMRRRPSVPALHNNKLPVREEPAPFLSTSPANTTYRRLQGPNS